MCKFFKKLKRELQHDSVIPVLGIFPKKMKTLTQKDLCISMFIAALFAVAMVQKQPKCPLINEDVVCMYNEIFSL